MNVYKQVMLGLEKAIERETGDLFHAVCATGNADLMVAQARFRLRNIKLAALRMRELIDEEVRNADAESGAASSHVRGGGWQKQDRYSQEGRQGVRRSGQAWEATEVRPQLEHKEALDQSSIDHDDRDRRQG